jgi:hypothetical protein
MIVDQHIIESIEMAIVTLESIEKEFQSLFEGTEEKLSFLDIRMEYLQLFNTLAVSFHHTNTVNYLTHSDLGTSIFKNEVETAQTKVIDHRNWVLNSIGNKMELIIETSQNLENYDNKFLMILDNLNTLSFPDVSFKRKFDKKVSSTSDDLDSLIHAIEELRNRIIKPVINIIESETAAGQKIIDLFDIYRSKSGKEINIEELTRICEMLALGLDISPGYDVIKEAVDNMSQTIKQEVGSLRMLLFSSYEYSEKN